MRAFRRSGPIRRERRPGEINRFYGGRGFYFHDPDEHLLEVITRPYGDGAPTEG